MRSCRTQLAGVISVRAHVAVGFDAWGGELRKGSLGVHCFSLNTGNFSSDVSLHRGLIPNSLSS